MIIRDLFVVMSLLAVSLGISGAAYYEYRQAVSQHVVDHAHAVLSHHN